MWEPERSITETGMVALVNLLASDLREAAGIMWERSKEPCRHFLSNISFKEPIALLKWFFFVFSTSFQCLYFSLSFWNIFIFYHCLQCYVQQTLQHDGGQKYYGYVFVFFVGVSQVFWSNRGLNTSVLWHATKNNMHVKQEREESLFSSSTCVLIYWGEAKMKELVLSFVLKMPRPLVILLSCSTEFHYLAPAPAPAVLLLV